MCGIYGFISPRVKHKGEFRTYASNLMKESAIRGTDATGFAGFGDNKFFTDKNDDSASFFSRLSIEWRNMLMANKVSAIGHTRAATSGNPKENKNNHPFHGPRYSLVHNGMIWAHEYAAEKRGFKLATDCDSEILLHYIQNATSLRAGVIKLFADLDRVGSFSCAVLDRQTQNIHLFRNKDNPCVVARFLRWNVTAFASTPSILVGAAQAFFGGMQNMIGEVDEVGDTQPYALVTIGPNGQMVTDPLDAEIDEMRKEEGTISPPIRTTSWSAEIMNAIHGGVGLFKSGNTSFVTSQSNSNFNPDETQVVKTDACSKCLKTFGPDETVGCNETGCGMFQQAKRCDKSYLGRQCLLNADHSGGHHVEPTSAVEDDIEKFLERFSILDAVEILPPSLLSRTGADDIVGLLGDIREPDEDMNLSRYSVQEYMSYASKSYDDKMTVWRDMSDKRIEEMGDGEYLAYYNFVSNILAAEGENLSNLEVKCVDVES